MNRNLMTAKMVLTLFPSVSAHLALCSPPLVFLSTGAERETMVKGSPSAQHEKPGRSFSFYVSLSLSLSLSLCFFVSLSLCLSLSVTSRILRSLSTPRPAQGEREQSRDGFFFRYNFRSLFHYSNNVIKQQF